MAKKIGAQVTPAADQPRPDGLAPAGRRASDHRGGQIQRVVPGAATARRSRCRLSRKEHAHGHCPSPLGRARRRRPRAEGTNAGSAPRTAWPHLRGHVHRNPHRKEALARGPLPGFPGSVTARLPAARATRRRSRRASSPWRPSSICRTAPSRDMIAITLPCLPSRALPVTSSSPQLSSRPGHRWARSSESC